MVPSGREAISRGFLPVSHHEVTLKESPGDLTVEQIEPAETQREALGLSWICWVRMGGSQRWLGEQWSTCNDEEPRRKIQGCG